MGYTVTQTKVMIGLGVSSIGDSWYGFAQNEKVLETYYARLEANELPVFRGHLLSEEDLIIRRHILNLMCHFETQWETEDRYFKEIPTVLAQLQEMEHDGLVIIGLDHLVVTEKGKPFIRNICMAFDLHLQRSAPQTQLFSMTV